VKGVGLFGLAVCEDGAGVAEVVGDSSVYSPMVSSSVWWCVVVVNEVMLGVARGRVCGLAVYA
jgi:hypothetical protein